MSLVHEDDHAAWPATLLVVAILVLAWLAAGPRAQPPVVSSWGDRSAVADACEGFLIAAGTVDATEHQLKDGYFAIGAATLVLHPEGIPFVRVAELRHKPVEVVIREVKRRRHPERLGR